MYLNKQINKCCFALHISRRYCGNGSKTTKFIDHDFHKLEQRFWSRIVSRRPDRANNIAFLATRSTITRENIIVVCTTYFYTRPIIEVPTFFSANKKKNTISSQQTRVNRTLGVAANFYFTAKYCCTDCKNKYVYGCSVEVK